MTVLADITTYFNNEFQKGFKLPVTGKLKGKLLNQILKNGLNHAERDIFYLSTGRLRRFDRNNLIGTIGNNWCPADHDVKFLNEMYKKVGWEMQMIFSVICFVFFGYLAISTLK